MNERKLFVLFVSWTTYTFLIFSVRGATQLQIGVFCMADIECLAVYISFAEKQDEEERTQVNE